MKTRILFICFLFFVSPSIAQSNLNSFFKRSNTFFNQYVKEGKVDYVTIKKNFGQIDKLYKEIGAMDLSSYSATEKKAFYINAYNLAVIYQVSKFYPLKSALDKSGFFDNERHRIAGESMTLNGLEIKKLLLPYKDPRLHFVLACAAVSCPQLASFSYTPANLEQNLTDRTTKAINDPTFIRVSSKERSVAISKIFKWYKDDFNNNSGSAMTFINKYKHKSVPSEYKILYYEYNWSLNKQ